MKSGVRDPLALAFVSPRRSGVARRRRDDDEFPPAALYERRQGAVKCRRIRFSVLHFLVFFVCFVCIYFSFSLLLF